MEQLSAEYEETGLPWNSGHSPPVSQENVESVERAEHVGLLVNPPQRSRSGEEIRCLVRAIPRERGLIGSEEIAARENHALARIEIPGRKFIVAFKLDILNRNCHRSRGDNPKSCPYSRTNRLFAFL